MSDQTDQIKPGTRWVCQNTVWEWDGTQMRVGNRAHNCVHLSGLTPQELDEDPLVRRDNTAERDLALAALVEAAEKMCPDTEGESWSFDELFARMGALRNALATWRAAQ